MTDYSSVVTLVAGAYTVLFFIVLFIIIWLKIRKSRRAKESAWKQQQLIDAQIHYYSAPPIHPQVYQQPTSVYREKEIIREIVRVPCRYCGTLNKNTATSCPSCGARL